uniref:ANAPC4_WD40 domain-containing protein n=1 Tax=Caenorhabditis tropicalis TaxID=1561998 RepID=A0A1I7SXZ0_9PELO
MYDEEDYITVKAEAFRALCASKRFNETSNNLIELAYSEDERGLIVSAEDVILIYNLRDGSKAKPVECKKYGVDRLEYLTNELCVHSDPTSGIIRALNIPKKCYIRYFHGHTKKIRQIRSFPNQREKFMSSSLDGHVRMFDTKSHDNFGLINMCSTPLIAFDPEGILFAVATKSETIKLFDIRSFDLGPFKTFKIMKNDDDEWTDIEFAPCGKFILVSTKAVGVKWIDAYTGKVEHNFSQHKNPNNVPLRASVSSDSAFVTVGSADRNIYVYSTDTGDITCKLPTPYTEPSHSVALSHHQFLMASLGRDVVLWAPNEEYVNM